MKANKSGFIVSLVFTLIFLVLGIVLAFLPKSYSPVTVSKPLTVYNGSGYTLIEGAIKNTSDSPVTISEWQFTVITSGDSDKCYDNNLGITLQPGEEYEFDDYGYTSYVRAKSVSQMTAKINGKTYTVYSDVSGNFVIAVVMFIFAAVFAIISIVSIFTMKRQQKRYDLISANLAQMECHAQFLTGTYGEKGAAGKAAAKTAASALGGIFMAFFFGFGAYKIYGANNVMEFVITDGGLFFGRNGKNGLDLSNMTFIEKSRFVGSTVTCKKNNVTLKNNATGEFFNFVTKNSGITSEQLAERLNTFLQPAQVEEAAAATVPVDDPFAESAPAQAAEPVKESEVPAEEKPVGEEDAKQLPPDDPFAD